MFEIMQTTPENPTSSSRIGSKKKKTRKAAVATHQKSEAKMKIL